MSRFSCTPPTVPGSVHFFFAIFVAFHLNAPISPFFFQARPCPLCFFFARPFSYPAALFPSLCPFPRGGVRAPSFCFLPFFSFLFFLFYHFSFRSRVFRISFPVFFLIIFFFWTFFCYSAPPPPRLLLSFFCHLPKPPQPCLFSFPRPRSSRSFFWGVVFFFLERHCLRARTFFSFCISNFLFSHPFSWFAYVRPPPPRKNFSLLFYLHVPPRPFFPPVTVSPTGGPFKGQCQFFFS